MTRTALYRLRNSAGALLYVGISTDPEHRWKHHANDKPWWPEVADKTFDWHDCEEDARRAEAAAVRDEKPAYNRTLPAEDGSHRFRHTAPHVPCARARYGRDLRGVRIDDELWRRFTDAVRRSPDAEGNASKVLRQLVRWYCREPGAKLPERAAATGGEATT